MNIEGKNPLRAICSLSPAARLPVHLVGVFQRKYLLAPNAIVTFRVEGRFHDHLATVFDLPRRGTGFPKNLECKLGKVAHHKIEDLIHKIIANIVDTRIFEHQLTIHHERKEFTYTQQQVDIFLLFLRRWCGDERFLEEGDLLFENIYVRQIIGVVSRRVIMELILPNPRVGPCRNRKSSLRASSCRGTSGNSFGLKK